MDMGDIEKTSRIKEESLSSESYFQSLVEQACASGILSDKQLEKIQFDCLSLLAKQTERYNSGASSSIRIEAAQSLLDSIMFTIGVWLKHLPTPDEAVAAILKNGVFALYQNGRERISQLVKSTKFLHALITRHLLKTKNGFYSATVLEGMNGFFKLYYPEFSAQEIHITADYPVHHPMERLKGIEFIRKYLECIYYENLFCTQFSPLDVHHVLCGYDEHYDQLLFNLYEPVLLAAIGCILTGRSVRRLELTPSSIITLQGLFRGKTRAGMLDILLGAVGQLGAHLELTESLIRYLRGSLPQLAAAIENAILLQALDRVFIAPRHEENREKLIFSFGVKMEDEKYRKVLEEVMQCRYLEDKKALIKSEIHSLADFEDILLDAQLSEDEMLSMLNALSPLEIAALAKKYPTQSVLSVVGFRESEMALCECLQKFLAALPSKQQEWMKQTVAMLECR